MRTLNELEAVTTEWANARGIIVNGKLTTQTLKLVEELGELAAAILRNDIDKAKDGIGDCCVVLNNVAQQLGTSMTECWNLAYEEIKDRKGYLTPEGNFIKEADYAEGEPEPVIKEVELITEFRGLPKIFATLDTHEVKAITLTSSKGYHLNDWDLTGFTMEEAFEYLTSKGFKYV